MNSIGIWEVVAVLLVTCFGIASILIGTFFLLLWGMSKFWKED